MLGRSKVFMGIGHVVHRRLAARFAVAAALLCGLAHGCAAVTNPVANAIPVRRVPVDFLAPPKADAKTIPLTWLRQPPPDVYRLDAGDVLGVYIEGVLGDKNTPPPVRLSEIGTLPPALGYPIPVREDGTLPLPLIPPLPVRGKTLAEVQEALVQAYTVEKQILKADRERIFVSLMRPRQYQVLVVRQDAGVVALGPGIVGSTRRGAGATVDLPAYENDVLNALTRTGGLPGLEAMNEVLIQRGSRTIAGFPVGPDVPAIPGDVSAAMPGTEVIRIPLRQREGEPPPFKAADVVLKTGDIVFIEARDTEVFYTGGLLYPRQFALPRDYDLTVAEAVAIAGGPLVNGGITQNNLSGSIIASGLGSPSPSSLTVLRRTKGNGQIAIRVDLNRALNDPRENILVQAGDMLILQETVGEALTRYVTTVVRFNFLGTLIRRNDLIGTVTANPP